MKKKTGRRIYSIIAASLCLLLLIAGIPASGNEIPAVAEISAAAEGITDAGSKSDKMTTAAEETVTGKEATAETAAAAGIETLPETETSADAETPAKSQASSTAKLPVMSASEISAGTVLNEGIIESLGEDNFFYVEEISDELFARMWGKSFKENCTTPREELRYIRCLHCDIDGNIKVGELVMHEMVADTVCEIFHELYRQKYPIESMLLVDDFDASDEMSIMANNTSAFNFRTVDDTDQISNHAYGLAIDINPYYNVYYIPSENYIFPPEGWEYLDREADFPYKLMPGDICYELFTQAGFEWGGWWTYNTDYQHFQYPLY